MGGCVVVIGSRRRPRPRLLCVNAGVGTSVDESGSGVTGSSGVVCSGVVEIDAAASAKWRQKNGNSKMTTAKWQQQK